jgi:hypothetical protein
MVVCGWVFCAKNWQLLADVDQAVAHLDPAWAQHATQRWAARPARLAYD